MQNKLGRISGGPVLGLLVFLALRSSSPAPEAARLAGVLACTVFWWISEAMPLAVSGLLASSFCVLFGVAPARKVLAPYSDPVIFLFLGSFWIAESMSVHGLGRRLALHLLRIDALHRSPRSFLLGIGLASGFISLWVSNTATTAMLLPIVLGMLEDLPPESLKDGLEWRALLMLAFSASLGGLGTPVGTPPNLIGIGMMESLAGIHISFLQWMKTALPLAMAAIVFLFFLLGRGLSAPKGWEGLRGYLGQEERQIGKWSRGEINTLISLACAVLLWIGAGQWIEEGISALLAASLLFLLADGEGRPTLSWSQAVRIDWGTILLFGSGMSLGQLLFDTGLAQWTGSSLMQVLGVGSPFGIAGVSAGLALLTSELASNTASANISVPVAIALAQSAGTAVFYPALAATLASSFGFLLPVATPPNALVYGTGKVPFREMFRNGLILDIFGFFLIWLGLRFLL